MSYSQLFSIIVPIYNSERYLADCLDSIIRQTFPAFEVLMIDDGSMDSSAPICNDYVKRDERFKLIQQPNAGTSAARNTGIRNASGKYITFIDNDDFWIENDALESMAHTIESTNADIVVHESVVYQDGSGEMGQPCQPSGLCEKVNQSGKAEAIRILLPQRLLCSAVWTMACRRDLIVEHGILFPEGMRNEDTLWMGKSVLFCNKIAWCDKVFYAYRKGHDYAQTSHPLTLKQIEDLAVVCDELARYVEDNCSDQDVKRALFGYVAYPYFVLLGQSALIPKDVYAHTKTKEVVESLAWLLKYDDNPNVRKAKFAKSLLGLNATRSILGKALTRKYTNLVFE